MYILASDFFEKDDRYVFKAWNSCFAKGIISPWIIFIVLFKNKPDDILKTLVNNRLFNTQYPFVFVWAGREY